MQVFLSGTSSGTDHGRDLRRPIYAIRSSSGKESGVQRKMNENKRPQRTMPEMPFSGPKEGDRAFWLMLCGDRKTMSDQPQLTGKRCSLCGKPIARSRVGGASRCHHLHPMCSQIPAQGRHPRRRTEPGQSDQPKWLRAQRLMREHMLQLAPKCHAPEAIHPNSLTLLSVSGLALVPGFQRCAMTPRSPRCQGGGGHGTGVV